MAVGSALGTEGAPKAYRLAATARHLVSATPGRAPSTGCASVAASSTLLPHPGRRPKLRGCQGGTGARETMDTAGLRVLGQALAAVVLLTGNPGTGAAQDRLWRHGIIEAKSDAGFQVMAVR